MASVDAEWMIRPLGILMAALRFALVLFIGHRLFLRRSSLATFGLYSILLALLLSGTAGSVGSSAASLLIGSNAKHLGTYINLGSFGLYGPIHSTMLVPGTIAPVLLLAAIALALRHRVAGFGLAAGSAVLVHPGFAAPAACLFVGWWVARRHVGLQRVLITLGSFSLPASLGLGLAAAALRAPSSAQAEAERILLFERIPHHAWPPGWQPYAMVTGLIIIGLALAILQRQSKWFPFLALCALVGGLATVAAFLMGSPKAMLLMPHRQASALLPVFIAVIVAWSAKLISKRLDVSRLWLLVTFLGAIWCIDLVRVTPTLSRYAEHKPGELATARVSRNLGHGAILTPDDWSYFRMLSGHPTFVDWKSHPFKADEILEWRRRVELSRAYYRNPKSAEIRDRLRLLGVRYVVLPLRQADGLQEVAGSRVGDRAVFRF
jgi:hypothetical protein